MVYKKTYDIAGTSQAQMLYLHRDYQGSILAITNDVGVILEKRQFDAWGAIVQVQDGAGNILNGLTILDRGYTGHEHLQSVGLIHMNGRLYDPKLHRFLQPDNYVQDSSNSQNFNRYGYCWNNPLKYSDPSGESFKHWWNDNWKSVVTVGAAVLTAVVIVGSLGTATPLVAAAWAGAGAGFVGGTLGTALGGGTVGESLMAGLTGAALGAFTGFAGAYASAAIGAVGIIPGALSGSATSTALGAMTNLLSGKDWDAGLGMTAVFGAVGGALSGLQAAKDSGSGIWFGKTAKPSTSVISGNINGQTKQAQVEYEKTTQVQTEPIEFSTSSTSIAPSRNYTIYDAEGELYKFGVTDANFSRMNQSLKMAGEGATAKFSDIVPKFQAHLNETFMRSLHYNSTGNWNIRGMIYPYPRSFDTGLRITKP